jgi:hypothetical protein
MNDLLWAGKKQGRDALPHRRLYPRRTTPRQIDMPRHPASISTTATTTVNVPMHAASVAAAFAKGVIDASGSESDKEKNACGSTQA